MKLSDHLNPIEGELARDENRALQDFLQEMKAYYSTRISAWANAPILLVNSTIATTLSRV